MCKLHHAAFDNFVLGITPDYEIRIREDVLDEIDGPMLLHGLQEMHGHRLIVPRAQDRGEIGHLPFATRCAPSGIRKGCQCVPDDDPNDGSTAALRSVRTTRSRNLS
jgi:hypothetical protein